MVKKLVTCIAGCELLNIYSIANSCVHLYEEYIIIMTLLLGKFRGSFFLTEFFIRESKLYVHIY
jgi:hypothetical protein